MAKFTFKYEAMKKYRSHRLLIAKKELAQLEEHLNGLKGQLQKAVQERGSAIEGSLRLQARTADFMWYPQLVEIQTQRLALLDVEIKHMEGEFTRHARWVAQLGQELKIVEKLEERQRAAFEAEERNVEKRKMDRWVAERWQRGAK